MSKIIINDLNFHYSRYFNPVFEQVNLVLDTDWRLGLIGRNGRGKTTFLKLLQGALQPDRGTIIKDTAMEYFPYDCQTEYQITIDILKELIGNFKTMEVTMEELLLTEKSADLERYSEIQECYQQAGGYEIDGRIRKELYLMGLSEKLLERDFATLSGGERSKIRMIALFLRPNPFVLIDEPTNHLDYEGKQAIAHYLKQKSGYLVVSHDRNFLDEVTDHILAINKCSITLEQGNYSSWQENKEKKEAFEIRTRKRLEREITVLEQGAVIRRGWAAAAEKEVNPYASHNRGNGSRAAKFMRQAKRAEQGVRDGISQKKELLKNYENVPDLYSLGQELAERQGEQLLGQLEKLTFGYDDAILFRNFTLQISAGERIWIKGGNGCGKSTLLKIISGALEPGQMKWQEGLKIAVSGQEPQWQSGYIQEKFTDEVRWKQFLDLCECLDITEEILTRPIETYSSGEMSKVDVARALSEENDLLLLDEPLNYMDIFFREQLEKAILTLKPTVIFVEHDKRFGYHIATRTVNLDNAKVYSE